MYESEPVVCTSLSVFEDIDRTQFKHLFCKKKCSQNSYLVQSSFFDRTMPYLPLLPMLVHIKPLLIQMLSAYYRNIRIRSAVLASSRTSAPAHTEIESVNTLNCPQRDVNTEKGVRPGMLSSYINTRTCATAVTARCGRKNAGPTGRRAS